MKNGILCVLVSGLICFSGAGSSLSGMGESGLGRSKSMVRDGKTQLIATDIEIALPMAEATLSVKARIPAGWIRNTDFEGAVYQPEDYGDYFYPPLIQYQAACAGSCDPRDIPGNIGKAILGIKERLSRPNINTGDPELDAVRAEVDIISDEKCGDDGWILAAAVTYPENLSPALYTPKIVVHSFRHHQKDGFFVQTTARAHLNQKEELLSLLIEACKMTDY